MFCLVFVQKALISFTVSQIMTNGYLTKLCNLSHFHFMITYGNPIHFIDIDLARSDLHDEIAYKC